MPRRARARQCAGPLQLFQVRSSGPDAESYLNRLITGTAPKRHDKSTLAYSTTSDGFIENEWTISRFGDDLFYLLGPAFALTRDILSELTDAALDNAAFPWLGARQISVAAVPTRALHLSYVGELGWERHMPMADIDSDQIGVQNLQIGLLGKYVPTRVLPAPTHDPQNNHLKG